MIPWLVATWGIVDVLAWRGDVIDVCRNLSQYDTAPDTSNNGLHEAAFLRYCHAQLNFMQGIALLLSM